MQNIHHDNRGVFGVDTSTRARTVLEVVLPRHPSHFGLDIVLSIVGSERASVVGVGGRDRTSSAPQA